MSSSSSLGMSIDILPKELPPLKPAKTRSSARKLHDDLAVLDDPMVLEMGHVSSNFSSRIKGGASSPKSASSSPRQVVEQLQSFSNPPINRFRVSAACLSAFANGMNDSAPGALIASIESEYNIKYGTVSIIFVCNAIGFLTAACFLNTLSNKIGRAKCLIISQILLMIGYAVIIATPPFGVVAACFFLTGVGMGMNLAINQVFCANLANNTATVGAYQGLYGVGGVCGPLIATALVSGGSRWSKFYIVELCLATANLVIEPWTMWNLELEMNTFLPQSANGDTSLGRRRRDGLKRTWQSFRTLMSDRTTVLGSLFIFAYQGAEVAISGWIISFLVQFRHGDPSKVGYVTSGFWGGITVGRFTLSFLSHHFGERRSVFVFTFGALVLEILIWFVPSIVGDSVAVAFSGLLLGPVSPSGTHVFQRSIPRKMQISSLSIIGSVGSSGGAVAPFMTGMLAQHYGTYVLHPICIGLFVCMGITWYLLPEVERRDD